MSIRFSFFAAFMLFGLSPTSFADSESGRDALRVEVEQLLQFGRLSIGDIDIASVELIAEFYERRDYAPAWNRKDQISELVSAIKATSKDGLNPSDYHLDSVLYVQSAMDADRLDTPEEIADADLILTDSLIRLGYHQRFGKVNPYSLDPNWNFRRELNDVHPATAIQEAIDSDSLITYLHKVFPRGWVYMQLRDGLSRYREIAAAGGWPMIPDGPTLRPGAADPRLSALMQRLAITGDMDSIQTFAPVTHYDEMIQAGVRHFQERHGLDADGIIGPATIKALNVSAEQRVLQLEINLERARWVLDDISDNFILVNIAGFRVYLMHDRKIAWESKVQVGTTYHQSPVFRDEMKYVDFNPTWTVPYSIASKEMLPKIQADPDFFKKRDFDVKDRGGKLIDPETVDWSKITRRNFRYTLVQRPGPGNALGRVKFMFPNKHAVYLHDTPSKYLFGQAERAFSHGCIRVEHPFDFAELLLGPGWDQEKIKTVLDSKETKTILLPKPLPVLLMYWTAIVREDGEVFFYNDVYERDQKIRDALNEDFRIELPER
jgi:murein L,D-transpeptidase YcbB/YkuD